MKINWPLGLVPSNMSVDFDVAQQSNSSGYGGSMQVLDLLNDRWRINLTFTAQRLSKFHYQDGFFNSLRGKINTTDIYHFARPYIRGSLSGTPTISGSVSIGASSVQILTNPLSTSATLKMGDIIGVDGMWLMIAEDCQANSSGVLTCKTVNRIRKTVSSGTAVNYVKPKLEVRCSNKYSISFSPGQSNEFSIEMVEAI